MYPVQVLHMHLRATKEIRKSKTKLLISFLKPHSAVTVKTILKRIKTFLEEAGIDTNIFQGHSLHNSSSSKAKLNNANITQILNTGDGYSLAKFTVSSQELYRKWIPLCSKTFYFVLFCVVCSVLCSSILQVKYYFRRGVFNLPATF